MTLPEKKWLKNQTFGNETPVTSTCLNLTFSNKHLVDRCCSISRSVNHVSDHGFECLLGSMVSTDGSGYAAKFCFASVYKCHEKEQKIWKLIHFLGSWFCKKPFVMWTLRPSWCWIFVFHVSCEVVKVAQLIIFDMLGNLQSRKQDSPEQRPFAPEQPRDRSKNFVKSNQITPNLLPHLYEKWTFLIEIL